MRVKFITSNTIGYVRTPKEMGEPRSDQLVGTKSEKLVEIAGRVCYDSLGTGRSSQEYHKHLLEVGHLSVHEHVYITVRMPFTTDRALAVSNRPGVYARRDSTSLRVSLNLRSILEWSSWNNTLVNEHAQDELGSWFKMLAHQQCPQIIPAHEARNVAVIVRPEHDDEIFVSMWLKGSRGFSHELVRHGNFTAISQRSTRYVDESQSEYEWHPTLREVSSRNTLMTSRMARAQEEACTLYQMFVDDIVAEGFTRKEARGAARGVLGNALATQLVFTASITQWKRIIAARVSEAADAEIRDIMKEAEACLVLENFI